jgi:ATP-dependent DNA helicase RecG
MNPNQLTKLLSGLVKLSKEKEWVEFKENNSNAEEIGEYISALSNSARLKSESCGYMVWGIRDQTHEIIGTNFNPQHAKQGNEELEHWLVRLLSPRLDLKFHNLTFENKNIVILEIPAASHTPVLFKGTDFIRIGTLKKKLKDYPEKERELWKVFDTHRFENELAINSLEGEEILKLLDYSKYFEMTSQSLPHNRDGIFEKLKEISRISVDYLAKPSESFNTREKTESRPEAKICD